jgi:hypothetical protein
MRGNFDRVQLRALKARFTLFAAVDKIDGSAAAALRFVNPGLVIVLELDDQNSVALALKIHFDATVHFVLKLGRGAAAEECWSEDGEGASGDQTHV